MATAEYSDINFNGSFPMTVNVAFDSHDLDITLNENSISKGVYFSIVDANNVTITSGKLIYGENMLSVLPYGMENITLIPLDISLYIQGIDPKPYHVTSDLLGKSILLYYSYG